MSLAQESYISPLAHHTSPPSVMDLNNVLQTQQAYNNYAPPPEGSQQPQDSPHIQLPPEPMAIEPPVVSTIHEGRLYSLDIVQQPVRARMCGFGDKDRRPITSPPCIRLVVKDAQTKQEIDINDIDTSYFVLSVDLWSAEATKEVNLVRHSATSPSISAATSASYPPNTNPTGMYQQEVVPQYGAMYQQSPVSPQHYQAGMVTTGMHQPLYTTSYGSNAYPKQSELAQYQQAYKHQELQQQQNSHHHHLPSSQPPVSLPPPQSTSEQMRGYYTAGPSPVTPSTHMGFYGQQGPLLTPDQMPPSTDPRAQLGGMFTRNLIGSLCVSAFKLTDTENKVGVWFVLQDLSVRTEGTFRLKLNFVNVGQTPSSAPTTPSTASHQQQPQHILPSMAMNSSSAAGSGSSAGLLPSSSSSSTAAATATNTTSMTSPPPSSPSPAVSSSNNNNNAAYSSSYYGIGKLNTGSAPVLASCFSDAFEVFSAKKFPGVIESTKLSKCFATQGIKIPIRKDGARGNERGRGGGDDEDD